MIKNFARIRQLAGEKLGSIHCTTLPSEEFKDFQLETKLRHEDFDEMRHTISAAVKHIPLKKNSSDGGHRRSLIGDFGESLVTHASMFPSDSIFWKMLTALGQGERQLSEAEGRFADAVKEDYMALLFEYDRHYKVYQSLCRKLESRRLDYDAKCNRLQKAKKESPECEQSVQAAKAKYEETELDVAQSMIYLQETEVDHCDGLHSLLDSQLEYHGKAFDILQSVKTEWDHWTENGSKTGFSPISTLPNQFSNCGGKSNIDDRSKPTLRRALYDHIQDLDDELTFHVNDIITVLHKVDDGWWLGELKDKNNLVYRGIFPVNYTEPYTNAIDQIDNDTNFMKNDEPEHDQEHTANDRTEADHAITGSTSSVKTPQHIDTQNIRSVPPSTTETPVSSFVSPSISSQVSENDLPACAQSKRSSLSSSISTVSAPMASSSLQGNSYGTDKAPMLASSLPTTPNTPLHQKASAPPTLSSDMSTPFDKYHRPLPPIPSDD